MVSGCLRVKSCINIFTHENTFFVLFIGFAHAQDEGYGELMFSLSYLSSAERLTVAVIKARRLRSSDDSKTFISKQTV
jgi:hypothetical protein